MFALSAILICAIEILASHFITTDYSYDLTQIEVFLVSIMAVKSERTQMHNSVFAIFIIWFGYILTTDRWFSNAPLFFASYEATILSIIITWAFIRPYFYVSADLSARGENVLIGFYQGTRAPFLSSVGALLGLSFSSVIIVYGETVLRSSGSGKMVLNTPSAVSRGDYTFINTGKKVTPKIIEATAKCVGKPTKAFGIFRTKCVHNCEPVLEMLELKPKSFFHRMPSIFYYQVVRGKQ